MGYKETARELYREAAVTPDPVLCCTTTPVWRLPDLMVPERMLEMNYGCGTTVHPRDLVGQPTVLYVGVGGGMELLQFAYFSRKPGGVVDIDPVAPRPLPVCDKTARRLESLGRDDLLVTGPTWFYDGGGCC